MIQVAAFHILEKKVTDIGLPRFNVNLVNRHEFDLPLHYPSCHFILYYICSLSSVYVPCAHFFLLSIAMCL